MEVAALYLKASRPEILSKLISHDRPAHCFSIPSSVPWHSNTGAIQIRISLSLRLPCRLVLEGVLTIRDDVDGALRGLPAATRGHPSRLATLCLQWRLRLCWEVFEFALSFDC